MEEKLNETLKHTIEQKVDKYYEIHQKDAIHSLIPEEIYEDLSRQVNRVTPEILSKIDIYLASDKGKNDIYTMVEEFFEQKGKWWA